MNCSRCSANLPYGAKFCNKCGTPVESPADQGKAKQKPPAQAAGPACETCGSALLPNAKFCAKCGTVVAQPEGTEAKATDHEAAPAASTPPATVSPEAPTTHMAGARSEPAPTRPANSFGQPGAPATQPAAAPDWVTDAMRYLQRIFIFDASVYSDLRASPQATAFSLMAATLGMFVFGLGGFLWTAIELDGGWEVFWKSALVGTLLGLLLWLGWVVAAVGVLTYVSRVTVRFDEVLRVSGGATAVLAVGFFMFIPGISFGVALVAVGLWVATSTFALQSAFGIEARQAISANIVGLAVWALILPLIVTTDNPLGPGIFLFDWTKDAIAEIPTYLTR